MKYKFISNNNDNNIFSCVYQSILSLHETRNRQMTSQSGLLRYINVNETVPSFKK